MVPCPMPRSPLRASGAGPLQGACHFLLPLPPAWHLTALRGCGALPACGALPSVIGLLPGGGGWLCRADVALGRPSEGMGLLARHDWRGPHAL